MRLLAGLQQAGVVAQGFLFAVASHRRERMIHPHDCAVGIGDHNGVGGGFQSCNLPVQAFLCMFALIDTHADSGHASRVPGLIVEGTPLGGLPVQAAIRPNHTEFQTVISLFRNGRINSVPHHLPVIGMDAVHQHLKVRGALWSQAQ